MKFHQYLITAIMLLIAFTANNSNAQIINGLVLIPLNPTPSDTVKVISSTTFPSGGCPLVNSQVTVTGQLISVYATHTLGMMTYICGSVDTVIIGRLDAGTYELDYNLSVTGNPAVFDVEIIYFTVQPAVGLIPAEKKEKNAVVFPNPFTEEATISIPDELLDLPLEIGLYDILGKKLRVWNSIHQKEIPIARDKLSEGIYFIRVSSKGRIINSKKIVLGAHSNSLLY